MKAFPTALWISADSLLDPHSRPSIRRMRARRRVQGRPSALPLSSHHGASLSSSFGDVDRAPRLLLSVHTFIIIHLNKKKSVFIVNDLRAREGVMYKYKLNDGKSEVTSTPTGASQSKELERKAGANQYCSVNLHGLPNSGPKNTIQRNAFILDG